MAAPTKPATRRFSLPIRSRHRDRYSVKKLTSAFGTKRKWAAQQSQLPSSKMTRVGSGVCIAASIAMLTLAGTPPGPIGGDGVMQLQRGIRAIK
jgi:hypothetical protein